MPSKLNYDKWDAIEVSDDSDIEGHPNVDHKSLVRWRQRDIHEKREAQKRRIAEYELIIGTNETLVPRFTQVIKEVADGGPEKYSSIVEKYKTQPSNEKPKGGTIPFDTMMAEVMFKIRDDLKNKGVDKPDAGQLTAALQDHLDRLKKADEQAREALNDELSEKAKKITSDDIHEGFSSTKIMKEAPPEPPLIPPKVKKAKAQEIEVLNPTAASPSTPPTPAQHPTSAPTSTLAKPAPVEDEEEDDEPPERIPDLTPDLLEFSRIPVGEYSRSYEYIQHHGKKVILPGAYDMLVIAGFRAAVKGDKKYARQCVHQALLIQYCEKLGKDGVQLFFRRMSAGDQRALMAFNKDLEDTLRMLLVRADEARLEEIQNPDGQERIQLVAEEPSQRISFNVPDGPPPEEIKIEGPGTEGLDPEEVKQALQRRWEIFEGFEEEMQKALRGGDLDEVNKVLGEMGVPRAEEVVQLLDIAGILSFSREGIQDQTGKETQDGEGLSPAV